MTIASVTPLAFLSACGGDEAIPRDVSSRLTQQVDAIERTADAGDVTGAQRGASDLRAQVEALREQRVLDEATAQRVLRALAAVDSELDRSTTTTASATTTTTELPPTTAAPRPTTPPTTNAPWATTTTKKPKGKDKKDE